MMETETSEKTLPRAGLVSQIRQNWSVFEDQALAQQIQQQEISQHLLGNRHRNQILREDIPQARKEQSLEEIQASREYNEYRQKLDQVSERDAQIAHELTRKQEFRVTHDAQYIAKRDEAFAKNLQRIEREYREKQLRTYRPAVAEPSHQPAAHAAAEPSHARQSSEPYYRGAGAVTSQHYRTGSAHIGEAQGAGGVQYNDDQYQVQVARPATITDEPLYMNNVDNSPPRETMDSLLPPTPFRGEPSKPVSGQGENHDSWERSKVSNDTHNVSSEWSGGRSSQSSMSRSRSSVASTTPSDMLGACGGGHGPMVASDVLGIGSALSPAELRAAETAERMLEQERRDMEMARQLQVSHRI